MYIRMRHQISGLRNGRRWPAPGSVVDLPDAEAATLVELGHAERVPEAAAQVVETAAMEPKAEKATPRRTTRRRKAAN